MTFVSILRAAVIAGLLGLGAAPAFAGTHSLPQANPVVSVTIPDGWKFVNDGLAVEASPEKKDLYVSFMLVEMREFPVAMKHWEEWAERMNIKLDESSKQVRKFQFEGGDSIIQKWRATDRDGETTVMRTILKLSDEKLLFATEWGSQEAAKKYHAEIVEMRASVTKLR